MAKRRSPHMTITVPEDLRKRMTATKDDVNWSAVAASAFEDKLSASLPSRLFKYRAINDYTETIFTKQQLYFANPSSFNDPFDSGFYILCKGELNQEIISSQAIKHVRKAHPELSEEEKRMAADEVSAEILAKHHPEASCLFGQSLARDYNDRAGVFCLAGTFTDILMWSHYANCHKGICLEFRTDIENSVFARAQPVVYADEYPHLDLHTLVVNQTLRDAAAWMLTKSSQWSYEREWRVLDFENGPGVRTFPPPCLSAVILGCCISDKERDRVLDWIREFPVHVRVLQAKKSVTNFRLEIANFV
jgi:hypothetical protein